MKRLVTWALATVGAVALGLPPAGPVSAADPALSIDPAGVDKLVSLTASDADTFSGISLDEARGTVTVRYVHSQSAAHSRLRGAASLGAARKAGRWRIEMQAVGHSYAELERVRQQVASDREWQRLSGGSMSEWYVDVPRNVVAVGVTKLSAGLVAAARARFGELVQLHEAARMVPTSRTDDWSPWAGGIQISSGGSSCTSGFAIEVPGTPSSRVLLTAGHCFPLGATVTNNGDAIGTVQSRTLTNNGKDYETIGGTFMAWTYTGGPTSVSGEAVKGAKASIIGQTFCTNGAVSGEVCSGSVTNTNICEAFTDGITRCSLDKMVGSSTLSQRGDSGGNIFARDADGLKIGGIIIGGSGTTTVFHPVAAIMPRGWRISVS